jgi:hypothetical protein
VLLPGLIRKELHPVHPIGRGAVLYPEVVIIIKPIALFLLLPVRQRWRMMFGWER